MERTFERLPSPEQFKEAFLEELKGAIQLLIKKVSELFEDVRRDLATCETCDMKFSDVLHIFDLDIELLTFLLNQLGIKVGSGTGAR